MKHDPGWGATTISSNPLTLLDLIEKTVLAQSDDQYPFATVYEQECALFSFQQNLLTNEQWYERFNTKVDVGTAIGVARQHPALQEHVAMETYKQKFASCSEDEQKEVCKDAEERYLAYILLRQSGKQHTKLRVDLNNDYTTGDDRYPKNRQGTLHLLDKYSKTILSAPTVPSVDRSFAQRGGGGGTNNGRSWDKEHW
jgi:hypothetical protein